MIVSTIVEPEGCVNGNVAVVIAGRPAWNPSGVPAACTRRSTSAGTPGELISLLATTLASKTARSTSAAGPRPFPLDHPVYQGETVDAHAGTGMLPSAMPSASLSSRFAHRSNPSYRWQSAFMSAPVDISINCLKVPRWSASDTGSAPSPPPWARTCVTWVSMVTASRRPRPYGGVRPGPWLSGESAEKPVGAPPPSRPRACSAPHPQAHGDPCPLRSLRAVRRLPRMVIPRSLSCSGTSGDRGLVMNETPPPIRIGPSVSVL
jgi:hypothetical protein